MDRREYSTVLIVNDIIITKVIIDPHYEEKHSSVIDDNIILCLVKTLDNEMHEPDDIDGPYEYFVKDKIELAGKYYKLIWLLEDNELYVGVVNAYRR